MELHLTIMPDGTLRYVHDDDLSKLLSALSGKQEVRRASHVEPSTYPSGLVVWTADLSPVGGPSLGPFERRGDALSAEITWLRKHMASLKLGEGEVCGEVHSPRISSDV